MREGKRIPTIRPIILAGLVAGALAMESPQAKAQTQNRERVAQTRDALGLVFDNQTPVERRGVFESRPMFSDGPQGTTHYATFRLTENGVTRMFVLSVAMRENKPALFIESCEVPRDLLGPFRGCAMDSERVQFIDDGSDGTLDSAIETWSDGEGGFMNSFYYAERENGPDMEVQEWERKYEEMGLGAVTRYLQSIRARNQI